MAKQKKYIISHLQLFDFNLSNRNKQDEIIHHIGFNTVTTSCQITFMGEVEKKSLILRFGFGLDCISFSFTFLPPFVLSVAFSPFCTALAAAPLELGE